MTSPAGLAATVLGGSALMACVAVWLPGGSVAVRHPDPCTAYEELHDVLDLATVSDQAVVRARAAALAEALGADDAVRGQILMILQQPYATVGELERVIAPVRQSCRE